MSQRTTVLVLVVVVGILLAPLTTSGESGSGNLAQGMDVKNDTKNANQDTDGDGLSDSEEENTYETNLDKADTDGDGLDDGIEVNDINSDPTSEDTDADGLADGEEVNQFSTDPMKADTDGDGIDDGQEVESGSDPKKPDANTIPVLDIEIGSDLLKLVLIALVATLISVYLHRRGKRKS